MNVTEDIHIKTENSKTNKSLIPELTTTTANDNETNIPSDFETAIFATEYGLFNYFLIILTIPCCFTNVFSTSVMSYVLPSAECDLSLTLFDKGVLNAVTYGGMISSVFIWGYLADTLGRKKLLFYGYFFNTICDIICAFSQTFWTLMTFKFLGGLIIIGPFVVLMSFLCEFHGINHRARTMLNIGAYVSVGYIILPGLAWLILPNDWTIIIIQNFIVLKSWQIFLIICTMPSFICSILVSFFPESPKFLMSQGRNEEALKVFQTVFKFNTGKNKDEYPIKVLVNELQPEIVTISKNIISNNNTSTKSKPKGFQKIKDGISHITPMFRKPYVFNCTLVFIIQFCILLGLNTLRLWVPQFFAITTSFEENLTDNSTSSSLCEMIETNIQNSDTKLDGNNHSNCTVTYTSQMYINSMYIGVITFVGHCLAGAIINAVGNKKILMFCLLFSSSSGIGLIWAQNSTMLLLLSGCYLSLTSISTTSLLGMMVSLVPTSLRTMTVSMSMLFGRSGAIIGNVIFPLLLSLGCVPPFLMLGSFVAVGGLIAMFLPETNKKALN